MSEKSGERIKETQWWLSVAAFLAGMAVQAVAAPPRPRVAALAPSSIAATTPAAGGSGSALAPVMANADRDVCDIQLD